MDTLDPLRFKKVLNVGSFLMVLDQARGDEVLGLCGDFLPYGLIKLQLSLLYLIHNLIAGVPVKRSFACN